MLQEKIQCYPWRFAEVRSSSTSEHAGKPGQRKHAVYTENFHIRGGILAPQKSQ